MVRVINFVCVAVAGLACLALYHVSERTRMANLELSHVNRQIVAENSTMSVLQAEWARVADPARIQRLAKIYLGLNDDAPTVELSSLTLLPRRGQSEPLGNSPVHEASDTVPAKPGDARIQLAVAGPGN